MRKNSPNIINSQEDNSKIEQRNRIEEWITEWEKEQINTIDIIKITLNQDPKQTIELIEALQEHSEEHFEELRGILYLLK